MPRVNERRVVHKSTGGIPPKIPTPVGPVGNAPNHLTPNTVALSAKESRLSRFLPRNDSDRADTRVLRSQREPENGTGRLELPIPASFSSSQDGGGLQLYISSIASLTPSGYRRIRSTMPF